MAVGDGDGFCGSPFWDEEVSWNTTNPDFTPCFQKTVLMWVPLVFLLLMTPYQLYTLWHLKDRVIKWNMLSSGKIVLAGFIGVLMAILCVASVVERTQGKDTPPVNFVSPLLVVLAMFIVAFFVYLERRKGIRTSGVLLLFWLLSVIMGVIVLRSKIYVAVIQERIEKKLDFSVFILYFMMSVASLVLSAIVDRKPEFEVVQQDINPCPEGSASFLSRITFWWFTGLVIKGFKRALVRSDLWSLNKEDTSAEVQRVFDKHWQAQPRKQPKSQQNLMANGIETHAVFKDGEVAMEVKVLDGEHKKPSLLRTLVKSFIGNFFVAFGFKLAHDILVFIGPQLLKLLIQFTSKKDEFMWKGYLYAVLLFVVALVQSIVLHQYFHGCLVLGMRLRSVIISAVYRKTLVMSNSAKKTSTVGEIVNLMSVDAQRFMDLMTYFHTIWSGPFQICVSLFFLWQILGPSVLAGIGVMVLLIPVNAWIAHKTRQLQVKQMIHKDARIKLMNEVLSGIKVLKLYAWEPSFQEKILDIRNKELKVLKQASYLNAASSFFWTCAPFMVSLTTFAVYTLSDSNNVLDAEKAFVSLSLFNIMRFPLSMLPNVITNIVQASVSLKRLQKFLDNDELDSDAVQRNTHIKQAIKVEHGTFRWDRDGPNTLTDINLEVEDGSLVAVVGSVGSGKSSLLCALLGEMEKLSGYVNVKGSVAYVAQQAWIQNATMRNNILFNSSFNQRRYDNAIYSCALQQDLDMLPAGDQTEIGEKGINLSGGQKQRVSLARATYQDADIYLLDDPLSAVDSHVGKHIFDHVIGPEGTLRRKTRVLVTHGISFLPKVDKIVVLKEGKISEVGSFSQLMDHNGAFAEFLKNYLTEELVKADSSVDPPDLEGLSLREDIISHLGSIMDSNEGARLHRQVSELTQRIRSNSEIRGSSQSITSLDKGGARKPELQTAVLEDGKTGKQPQEKDKLIQAETVETGRKQSRLIQAEAVETGRVKFSVFLAYLKAVGVVLSVIIVVLYILYDAANIGSNVWLSDWSNDARNPNKTSDSEHRNMRLGVYGALGVVQGLCIFVGTFIRTLGARNASRSLHLAFLANILHCPMNFFDVTPLGRIVNRFSKDVDTIDVVVPLNAHMFLMCFLHVISTIIVISMGTPLFLSVIVPLMILYYFVQRFYVASSRQLKRLESTSRSPIYSHFGETITGAVTIRAFGRQNCFIQLSESKVDENQVCYYPSIVSNRWLAIRLEFVGNCIIFFASLFAVLGRDHLSPGIVGLSVSYAMNVTQTLNWMVRMTCELETNIVAVERVKEYTEVPTEAPWELPQKKPDSSWPQEGRVEFSNYQVRYREGLDLVLRGINCSVKPGEKIGIVGRTGAGKSSLTLGLFRIIEPAGGSITIDGINIADIGLHNLRSKLTIIPQDPVLFSGSLRMNLDPFGRHSDEELWRAMEHAHLKNFVQTLTQGLDFECTEGGENLSVGQRQLLCLARALLRKTKILILDEATAAVDLETDDLIQGTIRVEFEECTVLTIAHRLNTIMDYTRIMVLDAGKIAEYDSPQTLLQNPESIFYGMAKDAGLV
ncbi:multidrug resistance-associated protein 1-like isoform X1 [Pomacea canaliculata]|uniref:multidrug resistance-associated protein 1-like isoform X1 n=1 Tax=Pomacea canaliculata TaxID=400727 RepID=UPI000D72A09E|nr:multidrug resistance-associated protein 1-like isoform X1 [Pomacea canaliculata]XP_025086077.1 multidrug resistance-associated protein 1-like isoform X1 [Pomacea canaliculata]XP_025086085.1 multidrug resistance-associated protein 1-like isoform X1 [Pomacea canaliculata]XP_025086094.1 multidrug resistance-associated protein 1-like isoform X1 [Pomacea canaliculata]